MYVMISFSVITCTYNATAELPRTLKSVAEQTYPHVEHLLIDGLSADATPALIQQYVAEMAQTESLHTIKVTSERDAGLYDAMNKGIAMATGTYLVFINAGDVFPSPSTLETVACAVGEAETLPAVLYGDTDIVDAEGCFLRHRRPVPRQGLSWRSFSRGMLVCHQAFLCPHLVGPTNALQPSLSFLGRCGLVHPCDESGQSSWFAPEKRASRCGQLPRWWHDG